MNSVEIRSSETSSGGSAARTAALTALFAAGFLIGRVAWNHIRLPFSNPWGVVGVLTKLRVSPLDDQVRFVVLMAAPLVLLLLAYLAAPGRVKAWLFGGAAPPALAAAKPDRRATLLLVVLFAFALVSFFGSGAGRLPTGEPFHSGELFGTAMSWEAGLTPYRDFVFVHGLFYDPLTPVVAFKIFGRRAAAVIAFKSLSSVLTLMTLTVYLLASLRGRLRYAFAAVGTLLALRALSELGLRLPVGMGGRDVCTWTFLIASIALMHAFRRRTAAFALSAFFFSFIPLASFAYTIDRGFFLTAVHVVFAALFLLFFVRTAKDLLSYAVPSLFGYAAAVLLVGWLIRWDWMPFLDFVFVKIPSYKELMDGLPLPIGDVRVLALLALMAANTYWVFLQLLRTLRRASSAVEGWRTFLRDYWVEAVLLILSLCYFRRGLGRSDLGHVNSCSIQACILTMLIVLRRYLPDWLDRRRLVRPFTVAVTVLAFLLAGISIHQFVTRDLFGWHFPLDRTEREMIPPDYRAAVDFLREELKPGDDFYTLTSEGMWYYWIDRPAPSRFPVVWFAAPRFYQERVVEDLKSHPIPIILWKNDNPMGHVDHITLDERAPIIAEYVREHYEPYRRIEHHEFWIRKKP